MKKLNKGIGYIVGAISIGAGIAHTLVPPTPNPLVAPEYFGFDLGVMIAAGLLFGIPMIDVYKRQDYGQSCSDPGKYVFKLWHVFSEMPASCNL